MLGQRERLELDRPGELTRRMLLCSSSTEVLMPEAVRLVVWDLDDTFWKGTVSEGSMSYNIDHHDIVVKLAERGIMSTEYVLKK